MKYFLKIIVLILLIAPLGAEAVTKLTFQTLPGLSSAATASTQTYINALYTLSISLAAILVVFKLMYAGVQYMTTDLIGSKEKAKTDIKGAILGLLIILGAVTILNTINPDLLELNFLRNAEGVTAGGSTGTDTGTTGDTFGSDSMLSCLPTTVTSSGTTLDGASITMVSSLTDATDLAAACTGGSVYKVSDGHFRVTCPASGGSSSPAQLAGFPIACTNAPDVAAAQAQCSSAGGSPSTTTIGTPARTVISCYP